MQTSCQGGQRKVALHIPNRSGTIDLLLTRNQAKLTDHKQSELPRSATAAPDRRPYFNKGHSVDHEARLKEFELYKQLYYTVPRQEFLAID